MSAVSRSRSRSPMDDLDNFSERRHSKMFNEQKSENYSSTDCRVYVANIPYDAKWQELKDLFRNEVGNVSFVEMFNDENGRPRGSAVVDFESPLLAQEAVEKLNKVQMNGRHLILRMREDAMRSRDFAFLFKDTERGSRYSRDSDRRLGNYNRSSSNPMSPPASNFGNTYGLAIPFLESLGITGPLVCKVFVSNLDFKVGDDDLRQLFKVAGKVTSAEVVKDQEGKSRGFGIVEYDHPVQAVQAISMLNNQIYFDRKLSIRMDRIAEKEHFNPRSRLPPGLKGLGMGLGSNGQPIIDLSDLKDSPCINPMQGGQGSGFNFGNSIGCSNLPGGSNPQGMMGELAAMALGLSAQNMFNMTGSSSALPVAGNHHTRGSNLASFSASSNNNNDGASNFNSAATGVQIFNLPYDYSWKTLKDLCRSYGDVKYTEIRTKGEGWVRFSNEMDARKAAEALDRSRIDGKQLKALLC